MILPSEIRSLIDGVLLIFNLPGKTRGKILIYDNQPTAKTIWQQKSRSIHMKVTRKKSGTISGKLKISRAWKKIYNELAEDIKDARTIIEGAQKEISVMRKNLKGYLQDLREHHKQKFTMK